MPFWQAVKRCENCRFWREQSPGSPIGSCDQPEHVVQPFWKLSLPRNASNYFHHATGFDQGSDCDAYEHDAHKPHALDKTGEFMAPVLVGDKIPMRTYERKGFSSHLNAEVLAFGRGWAKIRMLNRDYRMRTVDTKRGRAGTVVGLPSWGLDTQGKVVRNAVAPDHPERAENLLLVVAPKMRLRLRGLPPFDGMTRTVQVHAVSPDWIRFRLDGIKRRMHRRGPLAGVIDGELWYLDTEDTHAGTAEAAT